MAGQLIPIVEQQQKLVFGVQITFAILTILAVGLRLATRRTKVVKLQWEDYLILLAVVLCTGHTACTMYQLLYCGVGLHTRDVILTYGPDRLVSFFKIFIPIQILWTATLTATKLSILMFYCRVFPVHSVQLSAKIILVVILLWCLAVTLGALLMCRPLAFNWDKTIPNGRCGNRVHFYIAGGAMNVVTDLAVLCLPIRVILGLQMKWTNKLGVLVIFAVGFFTCVVSVIRLHSLLVVDFGDPTYSVMTSTIWSILEPSLAIILACTPALKHLFRRVSTSLGSKRSRSDNIATPLSRRSITMGRRNGNFEALDEYPLYPISEQRNNAS